MADSSKDESEEEKTEKETKKALKRAKRKELFSFNMKEFFKAPISYISKKTYDICGYYQLTTLLITFFIFAFFVVLVIYKNYAGKTNFIILLCNKIFTTGYIDTDCISKFVLTLVEIATLPFLILTLMFSAHSSFQNSERDKKVDGELVDVKESVDTVGKTNNEIIKYIKQNIKNQRIPEEINVQETVESENVDNKGVESINDEKIGEMIPDK